jgi:uncharacterized protein YoxC
VLVAAFTWSDLWRLALSIFLIAVGLTLAYVFLRLAGVLGRLTRFVHRTEQEVVPLLHKTGGTVDRVNHQLDKVDHITDSAVDAVNAADRAVRTVSLAVRTPVKKLSGVVTGIAHGVSSFKTHRDLGGAVDAGKSAAARRERDLEEELRSYDEGAGSSGEVAGTA